MRYPECGHHFMADESAMPKRCPSCHPGQRGGGIKVRKVRPDLEGILMTQLNDLKIGGWERQHRFHKRRWKFDFAWIDLKLAVEVHGGTYVPRNKAGKVVPGAHSRGAHQRRDFEKWSAGAIKGWVILHFDTKDVKETRRAITTIIKALGKLCPNLISHID